eukprot:Skav203017  [mRNA]  locus=scaffold583:170468:171589:+ [translate_table: standard]
MQTLCEQLMRPVSQRMTGYTEWMEAVKAVENARDLVQLTRCGKATLTQVHERLQQWKQFPEGVDGHRSKEKLLTDCCHTFIEHCAEIVEMSGVTPKLASSLLGASIRLAEVVGKTGLLVSAMESDFAELSEKVSRIEGVYEVAAKSVEVAAGQIAQLERQVDSATARAELASKRESEMKVKCQELKRSLQRQHAVTSTWKRPVERSPVRCGYSQDSLEQRSDFDLDDPSPGIARSSRVDHGRTRRNAGSAEPTNLRRSISHRPSAVVKSQVAEPSGGTFQKDPLEGAVQAAFDHLNVLLQQVEDVHGISHPARDSLDSSAVHDMNLTWIASTIHAWVDSSLKFKDVVLATSVKQSASNLQYLASLWNERSEPP